jgi:hypothetical protein
MLKNLTKAEQSYRSFTKFTKIRGRALATQVATEPKLGDRNSTEWSQAKPFSAIPGPNIYQMLKWFSAGGDILGNTVNFSFAVNKQSLSVDYDLCGYILSLVIIN